MSIGDRIRHERLDRHLSQEELAEALGVSAKSVSRWEKGLVTPQPHYRLKLSHFFEISPEAFFDISEEKQDVALSKAAPQVQYFHIPYRRNPLFTGRETVLRHLHESLPCQIQALSGLGGIGKTQTALEYSYRYAREYQAVLWVRAETRETFLADLVIYAHQLSLPVKYEQDPYRIAKVVMQWLTHQQRWLLVFDNVERLDLVADILPSDHSGHILLTTRLQATGTLAQCIHLEHMAQEEGMLLLLRRAKLLPLSLSSLSQIPESIRTMAFDLYTRLGGLPLALDQAGAYIEETGCSLPHYLCLYQKRANTLLAYCSTTSTDYPHSVGTTWAIAFRQIEQHHASAAALLYVCAFLGADAIPEELFTHSFSEQDSVLRAFADDPAQLDYALAALRHYSLLNRNPETNTLSLHRLVQMVIRERFSKQDYQYWLQQALYLLYQSFPTLETRDLRACERYVSHVLAVLSFIDLDTVAFPELGHMLIRLGTYFLLTCDFARAESLLKSAYDIFVKLYGPDHLDVALALFQLGWLFFEQGKYTDAKHYLQQSLILRETILGSEHADVAVTLFQLGRVVQIQGDYNTAEMLYRRTLATQEKRLESGDYEMTNTLNAIATLYFDQEKYYEALPLFEQVLTRRKQIMGDEHVGVVQSLRYIAFLYCRLDRYTEAEALFQEAIGIAAKIVAVEHHETANLWFGLGWVSYQLGNYKVAELYFKRTLAIREKLFGKQHLAIGTIVHRLGEFYLRTGDYPQAEHCFQRALAIYTSIWEPEHPKMASFLDCYATLLSTIQQKDNEYLIRMLAVINNMRKTLKDKHY